MKIFNINFFYLSFVIPFAMALWAYQELMIYFKERKRSGNRLNLESHFERQKLKNRIHKLIAISENDPYVLNDLSLNLLMGFSEEYLDSELSLSRLQLIYERIKHIRNKNVSMRLKVFGEFERIDLSKYYFEFKRAVKELFKLRILFNEKVFAKVQLRLIFLLNFKKSRSKFIGHRTKIIIDEENSSLIYFLV